MVYSRVLQQNARAVFRTLRQNSSHLNYAKEGEVHVEKDPIFDDESLTTYFETNGGSPKTRVSCMPSWSNKVVTASCDSRGSGLVGGHQVI